MKCRKCGTEIPEGKIYCELCGEAIQMVPDYDPDEDISIGTADTVNEKLPKEADLPEQEKMKAGSAETKPWYRRWQYRTAILCLLGGLLAYHTAYGQYRQDAAETEAEPEEIQLLPKPALSIESGTYHHNFKLILTHEERPNGLIYYTTDGTTPDLSSNVYQNPIFIEEGTTVIRAVFIRNDGMQSEEADGTYTVVFDYPEEPRFSVRAGTYTAGFSVSIFAEAGSRIYYTTNGEEPDRYASLYTEPIEIHPGLTVLQAVAIDANNRESGIVEVIYDVQEPSVSEETVPETMPTEPIPAS